MKLYSIEGKPRWSVGIAIFLLAHTLVLLGYLGISALPDIKNKLEVDEGWIGYFQLADFGLLAFFLWLLIWVFDHYLWKFPLVLKFLGIPNLNGEWIGTLNRTEFPSKLDEDELPIFIRVRQTYLKISFRLYNIEKGSISGITKSEMSVLGIENGSDGGFQINGMFESKTGGFFGANVFDLTKHDEEELLEGDYVSSFPRKGSIQVAKLQSRVRISIGTIKKMQSRKGETYYGVPISPSSVTDHRSILMGYLSNDKFVKSDKNRSERDGLGYHMTILSPLEVAELDNEQLQLFDEEPEMSFVLEKVGSASKDGGSAYFTTVHSPHGDYIRRSLGLPKKDFHVTMGFDPEDIHDHEKDHTTWLPIEQ